ncbi:MAG: hypothetical protein PF693_00595 [Spirochaetia bacterium]|jgi:hypothetical protein|nr:hypothetical protein [Spirochaetia bacterium]
MNKKFTVIFIIAILAAGILYAETVNNNKIAVLYNKNTQTNRDVLHFMGSQFDALGSQYQFFAVKKPEEIKPGAYKAVLVLNTGVRDGIDPKLSGFIDSWQNKSEIILISLYRGSTEIKVETIPSSSNPQGVDAVSAASLWKKGVLSSIFGNKPNTLQMHEEWVKQVLTLLSRKG